MKTFTCPSTPPSTPPSLALKKIAVYALLAGVTAVLSGFLAPASAHIVFDNPVAVAGSNYKAVFRIGHGCGNSPLKQIVVTIPAGVQGAKPMPKAGWNLEIVREKLATPYVEYGRTISEDVRRISWTAKSKDDYLLNDWFDEFVLRAKLPSTPGMLYWSVAQVCEEGRMDWAQVPTPGQDPKKLKSPAATLDVQAAPSGSAEHHH